MTRSSAVQKILRFEHFLAATCRTPSRPQTIASGTLSSHNGNKRRSEEKDREIEPETKPEDINEEWNDIRLIKTFKNSCMHSLLFELQANKHIYSSDIRITKLSRKSGLEKSVFKYLDSTVGKTSPF